MKDTEIFSMLQQETGLSNDAVVDYRPCTPFYTGYDIPKIPDAITVKLKGNGTLIYIPKHDVHGKPVHRNQEERI